MGKLLIVSLNLFAVFSYNLFFGGEVNIEQNTPEKVKAGDVFEVEITITKEDREGFAKWQQSLPEGFIAEAKETEGATFSFKNQEVKLIWMALPDNESFTISYTVKTDPQLNGNYEFNGKFSYIEGNERKDVIAEVKTIQLLNGDEWVSNTEEAEIEEGESDEDPELETADIDVIGEQVVATKDIKIHREIESLKNGLYEVTLKIEKGDHESFGKIEETLPMNTIASSINNSDGMFSFNNNVVKILWMTLPTNEIIDVKYQVTSTDQSADSIKVSGLFSYLDEDESKQIELGQTTVANTYVEVEEEELVDEVIDNDSADDKIAEGIDSITEAELANGQEDEVKETDEEVFQEEYQTNVQEKSDEDLIQEITNVPAPESNVAYRVQIAAAKKEVGQQYFIDRHNVYEEVSAEYHDVWFKYTIGSFSLYKQARNKRNDIWQQDNKINDAFVAAYNSGERVSVQEALMITKQDWVK